MTTRKHKPAPAAAAAKKRPAQASKPVKTVAAEKTVAVASVARDKDRSKPAPAPKKSAAEVTQTPVKTVEIKAPVEVVPHPPEQKVAATPPVTEARSASSKGAAVDKKPLGIERRVPVMPEDRQSQLKLLIARGKEQGYLTYSQVNDHLPSEIVDPEQIEDIVNTINDMGIPVYEKAPDSESLLQTEPSQPADEEAIEEAAAALAALDAELGRTTDPVRMYMREMGTVELLTREGEIRIAKRIEEGLDAVRSALAM